MNVQVKNNNVYQYRGCFYQKPTSCKYPINVSTYQHNNSDRSLEVPTLKYRGVAYNRAKQNYVADFSLSAYFQKYRGVEYLTCLTSLSLANKAH